MTERTDRVQPEDARLSVAPQRVLETKHSNRPDHDQVYLAERISEAWNANLSIPALQKLNSMFGRSVVTSSLRLLHGFPPTDVRSPYAYVLYVCKHGVSA